MKTGLGQSQNVRQMQTLAPQMRESLRILQMSTFELQQEIKQLVETNPVIESLKNPLEKNIDDRDVAPIEKKSGEITEKELDFNPNGEAAERTLSANDGYRDYFLGNLESYSSDEEEQTRRDYLFDSQREQKTLKKYLLEQLTGSSIEKNYYSLAYALIDEIGEDGYFKGSIPDIIMVHGVDEKTVLSVLREIQKFDPVGCGSRDLKECLEAQLERFDDSPWEDEIREIVENHLDDFINDRVDSILKKLNITREEFQSVKKEFKLFTPFPGDIFKSDQEKNAPLVRKDGVLQLKSAEGAIVVDVKAVKTVDGDWDVVPEGSYIPEFNLSKEYEKMRNSSSTNKEVKEYLNEKFAEVENVENYIFDREETILKVAREIVKSQKAFFEKGKEFLQPLTMSKVAEDLGVDVSTVSRAAKGKYMRTKYGVMEFKDFFVSGFVSESGESVSTKGVQERIKQIVASEDKTKPLSDEAIVEVLNKEGIDIKRRTVAKYRTLLGIPVASSRRR